ncbi:C40 family peptidase [Streptosporangium sp. OZ121]|uniref:C40 family peptidase n=1 Tax=Streptosporangium sp. OZ121 TaxID=3444183 RepID=UPI003F7AC7D2
MIKIARGEIGYRESGTNHQKYSPAVPGLEWSQNQPWCATFISWVAMKAKASDLIPKTASCLAGVAWFKERGQYNKTPKVGSIVYYGANGGTHVEIVSKVGAVYITTIGGNTGGSLEGAYHNGDGVYEKQVLRWSTRIHGYGHPAYRTVGKHAKPPASASSRAPRFPGRVLKLRPASLMRGEDVRTWQRQMFSRGYRLVIDGVYGPASKDACTRFQRARKLAQDGQVGPKTWAETWS